jgi:hypothetical protein
MASQKKLAALRTRIPSRDIFGPRPLIAGEDSSQYDELLARVSAAVRPNDVIEEVLVRDFVYHDWEIARLRRTKCAWFAAGLQASLFAKLLSVPKMTEPKARDLAQRFVADDISAAKEVDKALGSVGLSIDAATANTMTARLHDFEAIERLLAAAEARRHAAVRELDRRRSAMAAALLREEPAVEAEYQDVEEGNGAQVQQVNGRSVDDRDDDHRDHQDDDFEDDA